MRISETRLLGPREIVGDISEEVRALGFALMNAGLRVNLVTCLNLAIPRACVLKFKTYHDQPATRKCTCMCMCMCVYTVRTGPSARRHWLVDPELLLARSAGAAKDAEATLGRLIRIVKRIRKETARRRRGFAVAALMVIPLCPTS